MRSDLHEACSRDMHLKSVDYLTPRRTLSGLTRRLSSGTPFRILGNLAILDFLARYKMCMHTSNYLQAIARETAIVHVD